VSGGSEGDDACEVPGADVSVGAAVAVPVDVDVPVAVAVPVLAAGDVVPPGTTTATVPLPAHP